MQNKQQKKEKSTKIVKILLLAVTTLIIAFYFILDYYKLADINDVFSFFGLSENAEVTDTDFTVHYIDVGQGDCELIVSGDKTLLIDCGEYTNSSSVISYIKSLGINKIDYIIGTHPHSDHIGGMPEIISAFDVGTIIVPKLPDKMVPTTKTYTNFLNAVKNKGLKLTPAVAGTEYQLGNSTLKILAPVSERYDDLNDFSVVCKIIHGKNSFLFMGDAEGPAEKDILKSNYDLDSDVLKVGHHGSSTSSSNNFLNVVTPDECIISVGAENSYNHPNQKTVERLSKHCKKLYRTDLDGTIVCVSDGKNISFKSTKEE